jgi:hypothetical protein
MLYQVSMNVSSSPLILQNIPVSRLAIDHVNDRLVRLLHAPLLNPWLDLLVRRKLEHLVDFRGRANRRATDLDAASDEREGVDVGEITAIRGTAKIR